MATSIPLASLTDEQVSIIQETLTMVPQVETPKAWQKARPVKISPPICFYSLEGKEVRLPLAFANGLLGKIHNDEPRTAITGATSPAFSVKLRENQVALANEAKDLLDAYGTVTLGLPPGIGKCLDPRTPILRANGEIVLARDVRVGDHLLGDRQDVRMVLSVTTGEDAMFAIIPRTGHPFICNRPHILTVAGLEPRTLSIGEGSFIGHYSVEGVEHFTSPMGEHEAHRWLANQPDDIFDLGLPEYLEAPLAFQNRLRLVRLHVFEYPEVSDIEFVRTASVEVRERFIRSLPPIVPYEDGWEEIEFIAWSLGLKVERRPNGLEVTGDVNTNARYEFTDFVVRPCGRGPYCGFTLDGNGRFVLGDLTVTHNTILGTWLAHQAGETTMIYVTREVLVDQWRRTLLKCLPDYADYIWVVGEAPPPEEGMPAFIISLDGRWVHIPERIRRGIGTLIVDEAHMFCTPGRAEALLAITPRRIIIETATLERDDGMHQMIHALAGTHGVFAVSKVPYDVIQLETGISVELVRNKFGLDYDKLCKSLAADEDRNAIIVDIIKTNPHRKFIVLTRLADHVQLLELLLERAGIRCGTLYRSQKAYSDSVALIGTMPKIGTGFDEENACADFQGVKANTLILAHSVKKWQQYEQFRGRVMRSSHPVVIWLNDKVPTVRNHLKGLTPWITETQGRITKFPYVPGSVTLP